MTPVTQMTNKELRSEIEHIAAMLNAGEIGSSATARARIVAVMREAARRMKPDAARRYEDFRPAVGTVDAIGMMNAYDPETGLSDGSRGSRLG